MLTRFMLILAPVLFSFGLPKSICRYFLVGEIAPMAVVDEVRATVAGVSGGVLAHRLRSVLEAARRVSADTTNKSSEVIVAPGLYVLSQTALFQNSKHYTATDRLVIRAETLPDDPAWHPQQMPTVVTAVPLVADDAGEAGSGIRIEATKFGQFN
jgi:hypothetical protein